MFQLATILKGLLHLIAIPLYFTWFYFVYYMIFEDFKIGSTLFIANIVIGYAILFINKRLSLYQIKHVGYANCETDEERKELNNTFKNTNL